MTLHFVTGVLLTKSNIFPKVIFLEQMEQMEQSVQVLDYKDFVLFHDTEHYKNNTRVCPNIQSQ